MQIDRHEGGDHPPAIPEDAAENPIAAEILGRPMGKAHHRSVEIPVPEERIQPGCAQIHLWHQRLGETGPHRMGRSCCSWTADHLPWAGSLVSTSSWAPAGRPAGENISVSKKHHSHKGEWIALPPPWL
jgi:hypothetical protein